MVRGGQGSAKAWSRELRGGSVWGGEGGACDEALLEDHLQRGEELREDHEQVAWLGFGLGLGLGLGLG